MKIKAPDGKTYETELSLEEFKKAYTKSKELEATESIPVQEPADAHLRLELTRPEYEGTDLGGMGDEFLNTATFGQANRIEALGGATASKLTGGEFDYGERMDRADEQREAFRRESPWLSGAGGMAGSFVNPTSAIAQRYMSGGKLLGDKATQPLIKKLVSTEQLTKQPMSQAIRRGAAGGGTLGGLQALGESDFNKLFDAEDKELLDLIYGTTFGAGLGAAGTPIARGIGFGVSKASGFAKGLVDTAVGSKFRQRSLAVKKILEALEADGLSPATAEAKIKAYGPRGALMDAGNASRSIMYAIWSKPSESGMKLGKYVTERQKGVVGSDDILAGGQSDVVGGKLSQLFPDKYTGKANTIEVKRLYDEAFKKNKEIPYDRDLDIILKTPSGKRALKNAVQKMLNSREYPAQSNPEMTRMLKEANDESTGVGVALGLKLKTWDYVKRAMQDEWGDLKRAGNFDNARIINNQLKDLIKRLDKHDKTGGSYKQARRMARDDFENVDAIEKGRKFMWGNTTVDDITEELSGMSDMQKHHYRIGAVGQMMNQLEKKQAGGSAVDKIVDSPEIQKKIKLIFGDDAKFKEYMKFVRGEAEMGLSYKKLLGSPTFEKFQANQSFLEDPNQVATGAMQMAAGDTFSGGVNLAKGIAKNIKPPSATPEIANMLMQKKVPEALTKGFQRNEITKRINNALGALTSRLSAPQGIKVQDWQEEQERKRMLKRIQNKGVLSRQ